jgi:hypothetical protein
MAEKSIILSEHAQDMLDEREIPLDWIERVLRNPVLEEPDRQNPGAIRAYAPITEFGNRMLRVVHYDTETEIRVITLFFDRRMTARARMP